jgi:hypothetical protein
VLHASPEKAASFEHMDLDLEEENIGAAHLLKQPQNANHSMHNHRNPQPMLRIAADGHC